MATKAYVKALESLATNGIIFYRSMLANRIEKKNQQNANDTLDTDLSFFHPDLSSFIQISKN